MGHVSFKQRNRLVRRISHHHYISEDQKPEAYLCQT